MVAPPPVWAHHHLQPVGSVLGKADDRLAVDRLADRPQGRGAQHGRPRLRPGPPGRSTSMCHVVASPSLDHPMADPLVDDRRSGRPQQGCPDRDPDEWAGQHEQIRAARQHGGDREQPGRPGPRRASAEHQSPAVGEFRGDEALAQRWCRHRRQHLVGDGAAGRLRQPELGFHGDAMRQNGGRHRLHVLGCDVVTAGDHGVRPSAQQERQGPAWRCTDLHVRVSACRHRKGDAVATDVRVDLDGFDCRLHGEQGLGVDHASQLLSLLTSPDSPRQDLPLLVGGRIAEADPQQETVELRLGQRIGALVLDRVLRSPARRTAGSSSNVHPRR